MFAQSDWDDQLVGSGGIGLRARREQAGRMAVDEAISANPELVKTAM
jgi:hypothetical protein